MKEKEEATVYLNQYKKLYSEIGEKIKMLKALEENIKLYVKENNEELHSQGIRAVIVSKARSTKKWNTKKLDNYALKHPEILTCRDIKSVKCSVSIKMDESDTKEKPDTKDELDEILS